MRKSIATAAAVLACAAPLAAQEAPDAIGAASPTAAEAPAIPVRPEVQVPERAAQPVLPSAADRWQDARAAEDADRDAAAQQIGSRNWIYLAAAVAVGVIVAAIIL